MAHAPHHSSRQPCIFSFQRGNLSQAAHQGCVEFLKPCWAWLSAPGLGDSNCYQRGSKIKTQGSVHFRPRSYLNPCSQKSPHKATPAFIFLRSLACPCHFNRPKQHETKPSPCNVSTALVHSPVPLSCWGRCRMPSNAMRVYKHDGQEASFQRPGVAWKLLEMDCLRRYFSGRPGLFLKILLSFLSYHSLWLPSILTLKLNMWMYAIKNWVKSSRSKGGEKQMHQEELPPIYRKCSEHHSSL